MATTGSARRPAAKSRRRLLNYPRRGKGPLRRWIPSWRVVVGTFLGFFALGAGAAVAAYATTEVPGNLGTINDQVTTIYYSDGVTPITTIQNETRIKVSLADLPDYVGNAVVASEDATFWTNSGIDPRGLARALWKNVTSGSRQGGSTLTQQYVERTMTDSQTSYLGKVREMIIALKVTRTTEKEDILESYLNTIYWGRNVNGIEAAAQAYFGPGKSAKDLTISEAAMLAGIIPSPNNWDPDRNLQQAQRRWTRVMDRMLDQKFITQAQRDEATFPEFQPRPPASNSLGGQTGYIVKMVEDEIGDLDQFSDGQLRTRGLRVVTTIDKPLQDQATAVAAAAYLGESSANPRLRIGLVSMDPTTGELRTVYGGTDFIAKDPPGGQFNFAMQGGAQGGSTFKPFTLLGALEDGHKLSERYDGQSQMRLPGWNDEGVGPRNFGGTSYRNIDLVQATANSVNAVYAQLNMAIGPERLVEVAHELGIPDPAKDPANPTQKEKLTPGWIDSNNANVLGTATVRPVDLATAYATLANGGSRVTPHVVREVTDLDENLIYTGPTSPTRTSFDPNNIAAVTYALTHVVKDGSGRVAQELDRPVAGKTGTSNDNKAAWFAGYVPQLVTVVGLMQEDEAGNVVEISPFGQWAGQTITGSTFPVRAWTDFMTVALNGVPATDFPAYTPPRPLPSPTPSPSETPIEQPTVEASADPQADWVDVPGELTGRQVNEVTKRLESLGLRVSASAVASDEPKSTVLSVEPSGGRVPPGSTIVITVSTGNNGGGHDGGKDATTPPPATPSPTPPPPTTEPSSSTEPSADPGASPSPDAKWTPESNRG